ncbi:DUF6033 family protein [Butyrivibrio sp. YAB3001]|uniref:DUF6033 family protein n=1 Tax=Butyrivibrio sp. YAB3001 TaxID=1520812 RepID=UPI0008F62F74|nr:DUF6033 family protein [Butyrivibrio sp. YAB3001]SFB67758.1 hypothetical protein SAMN02910398_00153 [Butyrivibrio sp. YAB3001]
MANNISGNINQLFRGVDQSKNGAQNSKIRGPAGKNAGDKKNVKALDKFGESAKVEFSPEVEMYGKVVDLLQKKYDNADVFVAGPNDDLSQIGGELEYSIILSEDEMKLLASEDPKDKDAKDKLLGQIDDAMGKIKEMSEKISQNTDEKDEIANFGLRMDKSGKFNFFADINGKSYTHESMDNLVKSLLADKTTEA